MKRETVNTVNGDKVGDTLLLQGCVSACSELDGTGSGSLNR